MTKVHAYLNSLRIAPRKVRLVTDMVKGMDVRVAEVQLRSLPKRGAEPILKLIRSAVANAHHNAKVSMSTPLVITDFRVDEGRTLKRSMPRARGRAFPIRKRTSHISLTLEAQESVVGGKK
ncbi:MAG: 50S ribosomal protein L22 [Candidatus Ryanbacteria bacterium]|nr:50S ribosomal protein L22 [Candidatus Ryanbacteria bacterium]